MFTMTRVPIWNARIVIGFLPKKQCKYMGHDRKCAKCGSCIDCVKYESQVEWYEEVYNDVDYYLEYLEDYGFPPKIERPEDRILRRPFNSVILTADFGKS